MTAALKALHHAIHRWLYPTLHLHWCAHDSCMKVRVRAYSESG